jgi:hypothetical protein
MKVVVYDVNINGNWFPTSSIEVEDNHRDFWPRIVKALMHFNHGNRGNHGFLRIGWC